MEESKPIGEIFKNKPCQWGFRGDPHMWTALRDYFNAIDKDLDPEEFNRLLELRFREIIDRDGKKGAHESVWFEKFPQRGMSGGLISLQWWKHTGLPLLKERYAALKNQT